MSSESSRSLVDALLAVKKRDRPRRSGCLRHRSTRFVEELKCLHLGVDSSAVYRDQDLSEVSRAGKSPIIAAQ